MSRTLPSEAIATIARLFPGLNADGNAIAWTSANRVSGILRVVEAVPRELIMVSGETAARFYEALGTIVSYIDQSHARGSSAVPLEARHIVALRQALEKCPDAIVPATVSVLAFVDDVDLRESLRLDLAEVERALIDGEWKSATVVAGSVIEALLLWRLRREDARATDMAAALKENPTKSPIDEWNLHHYIEVAHALKLVTDDTANQIRLAKRFRNLIHPGRAIRLATPCDRGTARGAAAGIDLLVRDLS